MESFGKPAPISDAATEVPVIDKALEQEPLATIELVAFCRILDSGPLFVDTVQLSEIA